MADPTLLLSYVLHECVSTGLVTQHAKRMRRVTFLSMACLAVPYFFYIIS
jgi:hypothetical protein